MLYLNNGFYLPKIDKKIILQWLDLIAYDNFAKKNSSKSVPIYVTEVVVKTTINFIVKQIRIAREIV